MCSTLLCVVREYGSRPCTRLRPVSRGATPRKRTTAAVAVAWQVQPALCTLCNVVLPPKADAEPARSSRNTAARLTFRVDTSARRLSELVKKEEKFGHADDFFKEVPALGATRLVSTTNRLFKRSVSGLPQRTSSLEDIVAHLAMFESSEPRDTVYALLALAKDSQPSVEGIPDHLNSVRLNEHQKKALVAVARLLPNPYRQSYIVNYKQRVADVYQQFIAFAISKADPTQALDIICRPFAPPFTREQDFSFDPDLLKDLTKEQKEHNVKLPSWMTSRTEVPFEKQIKPRQGDRLDTNAVFSMERQRGDPFVSTPDSVSYSAAGSKAYDKDKVRFRERGSDYSMFVEGFC